MFVAKFEVLNPTSFRHFVQLGALGAGLGGLLVVGWTSKFGCTCSTIADICAVLSAIL